MISGLSVPMNWIPVHSWKLLGPQDVERDGCHLSGQHQRREHEAGTRCLRPAPVDPGEGVGHGHAAADDPRQWKRPAYRKRVSRPYRPTLMSWKHGGEVRPHERVRPQRPGQRLVVALQRGEEHVDDREQERRRRRRSARNGWPPSSGNRRLRTAAGRRRVAIGECLTAAGRPAL